MNASESQRRLDALLSESRASAVAREADSLEDKVGSLDGDFILFGAGHLGRKVLRTLRGIGKAPVAFIDNNPKLWGTSIDGVPVWKPSDAATRVDPSKVGVITTIWCGEATDKMSDRIEPLRRLGFAKIGLFGHLAWKFPDAFLPHYCLDKPSKVIEQAARVRQAFALLGDEASRALFVNHVEWRLFLDYDLLPPPSPDLIYFNPHYVSRSPSEVLYDIGAYTGDSIESFLATPRGSAFAEIHAFEPSSGNYPILADYVSKLGNVGGRIFAHRLALGAENGFIQVESGHGPASRVGKGDETVAVTTIDEFAGKMAAPTFIKIDIEGFEPECLEGARATIARDAPAVACCVYHLQSHLWDIALQLDFYRPGYQYRLCPHLADGWDLVLYAVPPHRLPT